MRHWFCGWSSPHYTISMPCCWFAVGLLPAPGSACTAPVLPAPKEGFDGPIVVPPSTPFVERSAFATSPTSSHPFVVWWGAKAGLTSGRESPHPSLLVLLDPPFCRARRLALALCPCACAALRVVSCVRAHHITQQQLIVHLSAGLSALCLSAPVASGLSCTSPSLRRVPSWAASRARAPSSAGGGVHYTRVPSSTHLAYTQRPASTLHLRPRPWAETVTRPWSNARAGKVGGGGCAYDGGQ